MITQERKWLRDSLTPASRIKYLLWRLSKSKKTVVVNLEKEGKIEIRPQPTTDMVTGYEMFVAEAYKQPSAVPKISPNLIIDIGANVGYSLVYWANLYPNAKIVAFEPHPAHLEMIYKNIHHNSLSNKVKVIESAASNKNAQSFLTDNENESIVVDDYKSGTISIKVRDLFEEIGNEKIDLLKMDIEGGEYSILGDRRFEKLNVQTLVLEWHNTEKIDNGLEWSKTRLISLGYQVIEGQLNYEKAGILWGWKNEKN